MFFRYLRRVLNCADGPTCLVSKGGVNQNTNFFDLLRVGVGIAFLNRHPPGTLPALSRHSRHTLRGKPNEIQAGGTAKAKLKKTCENPSRQNLVRE